MSVLKCNRTESKVQFITTAIEIEGKTILCTIWFLMREKRKLSRI